MADIHKALAKDLKNLKFNKESFKESFKETMKKRLTEDEIIEFQAWLDQERREFYIANMEINPPEEYLR